jgi:hypothetical protein
MPNKSELRRLEKRITALSSALAQLGRGTDLRKLVVVIRRPGWTTPAEFPFATGLLDGMLAHVTALAVSKAALLQASAKVRPQGSR